jgi:hypothetical protein
LTRSARWPHAIGAFALSSILIVGATSLPTWVNVVLVLAATACTLDLVRREARDPGSPTPIVCAIAALFAIAVIYPPRFSHDIWSYAMVGRIVAVHHASPYLHAPAAFGHDAFVNLVGNGYRHTTTPYGPLFTLQASIVALVGGSHPLLYRLAFQASAAAFVGVALCILWRTSRSTSALALLGLHPVIACAVISGGHNDAFVGLGLLLAVVDARRERYARAGWWITAALLVKVTAGLALVPIIAWAWVRGNKVAVRRVVTGPLLVGIPVMLLTPGVVGSLSRGQIDVISRSSIWNVVLRMPMLVFPGAPHATGALLGRLAFVVVIVVAAAVAWGARGAPDPAPAVVAAVAAWLIFGGYVLPWYTVWVLPAAALLVHTRLAWLVAVQGAVVTAAFVIPRSTITAGGYVGDVVRYIAPLALAVMFLLVVVPMALEQGPILPRARLRVARR